MLITIFLFIILYIVLFVMGEGRAEEVSFE